jgi:hypothetical protein
MQLYELAVVFCDYVHLNAPGVHLTNPGNRLIYLSLCGVVSSGSPSSRLCSTAVRHDEPLVHRRKIRDIFFVNRN